MFANFALGTGVAFGVAEVRDQLCDLWGKMPPHIVIPQRFRAEIDQHAFFNLVGLGEWPLILGVFGRPGDGKSFQVRARLEQLGVQVVALNAADLESDRAGQPAKLLLSKYTSAGERTGAGAPAALLVDDFDTTVGEWEHSTGTVNHQQVLAQLMHLADSPTSDANRELRRIPVFVTGNDLTKIYPPLRRPGRMRPFTWHPTSEERDEIVADLLSELVDREAAEAAVRQFADAPIAFFADLRAEVIASSAHALIDEAIQDLAAFTRNPAKCRERLDAVLEQEKPALEEILRIASSLWEQRTAAFESFVEH